MGRGLRFHSWDERFGECFFCTRSCAQCYKKEGRWKVREVWGCWGRDNHEQTTVTMTGQRWQSRIEQSTVIVWRRKRFISFGVGVGRGFIQKMWLLSWVWWWVEIRKRGLMCHDCANNTCTGPPFPGFPGGPGSIVWGVTEGGSGSGRASSRRDFCDRLRHLGLIP